MTKPQGTKYSGTGGHGGPRPTILLGAAAMAVVAALLFARQFLPQAMGQETKQPPASTSPSDRPPVAEQPAGAAAEAAAPCQRKVCRRRCGKCRAGVRLLSRFRRGCCPPRPPEKPDPYAWQDLFDGKTLEGWKTPQFGGEGEVHVEDGAVVMEMGSMMTGITWTGEPPRTNYEFQWEGARLDGIDFFATATFPVGEKCVSLVAGGWGGTVVGISCVDYYDASDNETTSFHDFKDKQWYKFQVRVTDAKIQVWIDDEQVVNLARKGHKFDIRDEVDLCRPLGISAWCTKGASRNIRIRRLEPAAQPQAPADG